MSRAPIKQLIPAALALSMLSTTSAPAANAGLRSTFSVSFLGVSVGKVKIFVGMKGNDYKISGSGKTGRIVSLVAKTRAVFSSRGRIDGNRVIPTKHSMEYKSNKKLGTVELAFADGDVVKSVLVPVKRVRKDRVPVQPAHLKSVVDPISSLLFPVLPGDVGNGRKICNRILPVYGGETRMNLVFSYQSSGKARVKGFKGKTFTCAVRYQPISGHRPSKKGVKYMQSNRDMQITVARIGKANVYGLFAFKVKTNKGMVAGRATRFASD